MKMMMLWYRGFVFFTFVTLIFQDGLRHLYIKSLLEMDKGYSNTIPVWFWRGLEHSFKVMSKSDDFMNYGILFFFGFFYTFVTLIFQDELGLWYIKSLLEMHKGYINTVPVLTWRGLEHFFKSYEQKRWFYELYRVFWFFDSLCHLDFSRWIGTLIHQITTGNGQRI